jgi:hypothetical protein
VAGYEYPHHCYPVEAMQDPSQGISLGDFAHDLWHFVKVRSTTTR